MVTPSVTFVVVSNDRDYVLELCCKYNGRPADVQRMLPEEDGNVTRFVFKICDSQEDGRLVPKEVWHVWRARSVTVSSASLVRVELPRVGNHLVEERDVVRCDPVFAISVGFQSEDDTIMKEFENDVRNAAPLRGSSNFYQQVKQVAVQQIDHLICREVLTDVHVFVGDEDPACEQFVLKFD